MTESDFLKNMIVSKYNGQHGKEFKMHEVCIRSVTPVSGYDCAYELATLRLDDYLRIRVNFKISGRDFISTLRNEIEYATLDNVMGDEILVGFGEINSSHTFYEGFKFGPLDTCPTNFLIEENGNAFVCEDGTYLQFEV